jgi:NADH-quinone oxidoreductase subunit C
MQLDTIKQRFGAEIMAAENLHGQDVVTVSREAALAVLRALRDEPDFGFDFLIDLTALDWFGREPRFEVVYQLKSTAHNSRLRVKVPVPGADAWAASAVELWKSADWLERECYDMFGIQFREHPDLRRILMYDSFVGHPLRKDYPVDRRQPIAEEVDPVAAPRPPSR